jgi:hypothetical protein
MARAGYAYVLKPLVYWGALALLRADFFLQSWSAALVSFVVTSLVINSRAVEAVEQAVTRVPASVYGRLPPRRMSVLGWLTSPFRGVLALAENMSHAVEEGLRPRSGDGLAVCAARKVLGLLWGPVDWLVRFYLVVLIEPGFNLVKAPLAMLAAKFIYPLVYAAGLPDWLAGLLGEGWVPWFFVATNLWLLPDALVFVAWEAKDNWKLYRAGRRADVDIVSAANTVSTFKPAEQL